MKYHNWNLIDWYEKEVPYINPDKRIQKWINEKQILQEHPNSQYKVGDIIHFVGGLNNDIIFTTKVVGFTEEGELYVFWDCWWFPIDMDSPQRKVPPHL